MFDIALDYQHVRDRFPRLKQLDYRELRMARLLAGGCSGREAGMQLGLNGLAADAVHRQLLDKLGLERDDELSELFGGAVEVAYLDDQRVSSYRPVTGATQDDVVFAD